jgi:glycosidase
MPWPKHPLIYEINTLPWLEELSRRYQRPITLAKVPAMEWEAIANLGVHAVWLMGVWRRSPAAAAIARAHPALQADYARALPDLDPADITASPYAVADYSVDPELGGEAELIVARRHLAGWGMSLLLDFVPNHTAPDHPWVTTHPDYYLQPLRPGRDPYFPPWTDTLQLNAFSPAYRQAAVDVLTSIAHLADGVRCDMAMLLLNRVFASTWNMAPPATDFWTTVIAAVRAQHPNFLFLAEAYWDLEAVLLEQGFDYCYDKRLYDLLLHGDAPAVRAHLAADVAYQSRLLRFLENHDEPRAAAALTTPRHRAAAIIASTLPGGMLLHHGQLHGWQRHLPVQLRRYPRDVDDPSSGDWFRFYSALASQRHFTGEWRLLESSNPSLLAWLWTGGVLIVVNFSPATAEGRIGLPADYAGSSDWILRDPLEGIRYARRGEDMAEPGLFVRLAPWAAHYFVLCECAPDA